ncbi:LOW QUALITY PROTEIN: hypothetical protein PHMEG_00017810 [Phytophthora megakarya]|uniref:Reverse transcriptase n=1 Tax=Phytophthora megakarya TaxID=4795 RepID=A0A225VWE3_9STRA|nr:LOW QUALITY PROTEIN: hypothetical protein PHMEG_00017810 [Phytophthora megakarya]
MRHLSTPTTSPDADRYLSGDAGGGRISESMPDQATDRTDTKDIKTENRTGTKDIELKTGNPNCQTQIKLESGEGFYIKSPIHPTEGVELRDLEGNLAVLPEIPISTTAKVSIEDLQTPDRPHPRISRSSGRSFALPDRQRERPATGGLGRRVGHRCRECETDRTANPESNHAIWRKSRMPDQGPPGRRDHPTLDMPWASPIMIVRKTKDVDASITSW